MMEMHWCSFEGFVTTEQIVGSECVEGYGIMSEVYEAAFATIPRVVASGSMIVRKVLVCDAAERLVSCRQVTKTFSSCSLNESSQRHL